MAKKKLSIIVPCYKVEKYLPRCLDSLVNQTLEDIEVICINDGSPDNCLNILKEYKEKYPDIATSGTDDPFYTNSSQLPVDYTADVFDALDHQESLQTKYTGGTMFHVFLGEAVSDWKACAELVRTIAENYRIPFFTISPTYSVCRIHGYLSGEHFECPKCRQEKELALRTKLAGLEKERAEAAEA